MTKADAIENRYDFVYLFDVQDGNPNGDPDGDNTPRTDYETGQGLVTDVCLKRKVRNYVEVARGATAPDGKPRFSADRQEVLKMFIREKAVLNRTIVEEFDKTQNKDAEEARKRMCKYYYDVRTFGAVMTTSGKGKDDGSDSGEDTDDTEAGAKKPKGKKGKKGDTPTIEKTAGQVRGAIQLTFARSIDPITVSEHSITRMAVASEEESKKQNGLNQTFGRKATVPYGLYRTHGFVSASLAEKTLFSEEDLELFWEALQNMFDVDRSAARGLMASRRLIVFKHDSALGNAPAHKLFDLVQVKAKDPHRPARSFSDYEVTIDKDALPKGVELIELI